ncbi:MAG: S46 family peptidase [Rikenellaceae bacterium]|nr:S46 family peptidase [Rikenellaceae bacterium]
MKKIIIAVAALLMTLSGARADEGMWLPSLIGDRIEDMKAKGFRLEASDIYDINNASMKDAIVLFGRGCTGELISPEGLLVTNHHCGYSQIQRHSTVEHNYLENGFWAMDRSEELPNTGLTVTFLVRMEDVTDRILAGTEGLEDGPERDAVIKANEDAVKAEAVDGTHYKAAVSKFYYGNQYYLYVNEVFEDVRLVGAPPSSVGKFGGDTDNWMWPRHTGDFSLFRIYAGPDNKPAPYSPDNVPYVPKKYFPVSTKGVSEGDFTMVYGFPGTTMQFITSDAVDYILNHSNPVKIGLRTKRLEIIESYWNDSEAVRIAYAAKHSGIANAWKKWQGESLGLERLGTIARKQALERAFEEWAAGKPEYEGLTRKMSEIYEAMFPYAIARDYYNETLKVIEIIGFAALLDGPTVKPGEPLPAAFDNFYADYDMDIDVTSARFLVESYLDAMNRNEFRPSSLYRLSRMGVDTDVFLEKLYGDTRLLDRAAVEAALADSVSWAEFRDNDYAMQIYRDFDSFYKESIAEPYDRYNKELDALYRTWVRGLIEFSEAGGDAGDLFPDANLTLRVAYGRVGGYSPEDAVWHGHVSTVDGILAKNRTGNGDYYLNDRVRELFTADDYGRWETGGTVPVCFLADNHTTGGNSGSPVINADGELVGVNFDRTWLSTMSDIEFDPVMCRNISLDIRYLLFIVDKLGGASYLFEEMDLR